MSESGQSNIVDVEPKNYSPSLRSAKSNEETWTVFVNTTNRIVDVFWINYSSQLQRFRTLHPRSQPFKIKTYVSHPWIFRDLLTGQLMHVNHQEVCWPHRSERPHIAYIQFPLQRLKTIALWQIVRDVYSEEQIDRLEIPDILMRDLKVLYSQYMTHVHSLR